ncbi:BnaC03g69720D [Brassica napus]|uniref:BnaC03g69720D protein n=2 Tax=Brassica napus TaxID=3708 RepID=A0A078GM65_BRANA|nr:BnaC03g69720D [Brassica napus]
MKQDGSLPDDRTSNALIRAHLEDGDKAASAEFIKEMRNRGSTFGLVTNMLHDGRLDKSFLDMLF